MSVVGKTCAVEGCDKPNFARGWCSGHYTRWLHSGDVDAATPLRSTRSAPRCGTYRAAARHRRLGESLDAKCHEAFLQYERDLRANPTPSLTGRRGTAARSRAIGRLLAEFPERYAELVAEELNA